MFCPLLANVSPNNPTTVDPEVINRPSKFPDDTWVAAYIHTKNSPYGEGHSRIPAPNLPGSHFGLMGRQPMRTARDGSGRHWVVKPIKGNRDLIVRAHALLARYTPFHFIASVGHELLVYSHFIPDKEVCKDLMDLIEQKDSTVSDWVPSLDLYRGILECVRQLHTAGLAHRDLSPENFVVTRQAPGDWITQIIDLDDVWPAGTERDDGEVVPSRDYDPRTGKIVYLAPEMIDALTTGDRPLLLPADLWAVGCVLLVLLGPYWRPMDETHQRLLQHGCTDEFLADHLPESTKQTGEDPRTRAMITIVKALLQVNPLDRIPVDQILEALITAQASGMGD